MHGIFPTRKPKLKILVLAQSFMYFFTTNLLDTRTVLIFINLYALTVVSHPPVQMPSATLMDVQYTVARS